MAVTILISSQTATFGKVIQGQKIILCFFKQLICLKKVIHKNTIKMVWGSIICQSFSLSLLPLLSLLSQQYDPDCRIVTTIFSMTIFPSLPTSSRHSVQIRKMCKACNDSLTSVKLLRTTTILVSSMQLGLESDRYIIYILCVVKIVKKDLELVSYMVCT